VCYVKGKEPAIVPSLHGRHLVTFYHEATREGNLIVANHREPTKRDGP
jgi:hypothetical protein